MEALLTVAFIAIVAVTIAVVEIRKADKPRRDAAAYRDELERRRRGEWVKRVVQGRGRS